MPWRHNDWTTTQARHGAVLVGGKHPSPAQYAGADEWTTIKATQLPWTLAFSFRARLKSITVDFNFYSHSLDDDFRLAERVGHLAALAIPIRAPA